MPDPQPPAPNPTPQPVPNPSIVGYFNFNEMRRIAFAAIGINSLTGTLATILVALGENAHQWYSGPNAAAVVLVCGFLASITKTYTMARKYASQGVKPEFVENEKY